MEYASEAGNFATVTMPGGSGYQLYAAATFTNVVVSGSPAATTATINAATTLHAVTTNLLGVNLVTWDNSTGSSQTESLEEAAGIDMFRIPGGSGADGWHFNSSTGTPDYPEFLSAIDAVNGTGLVTTDYGSGSPQEAAAELAYADGSPSDTTSLNAATPTGIDNIEWVNGAWQTENWDTVGFWASLRGESPITPNDGLNFLRVNHAAAWTGITYWEIGNEEYGSWESDNHGTAGPNGSTGASTTRLPTPASPANSPHLPGRSRARPDCRWFISASTAAIQTAAATTTGPITSSRTAMRTPTPTTARPTISCRVYFRPQLRAGPRRRKRFKPLKFHRDPERQHRRLGHAYSDYETSLNATVGTTNAATVKIMATEYNSVYSNPGKQSTSLVNGLFTAESLGVLLDSNYVAGINWDLRNGWGTNDNNSNLLYGWREGGDYGILGDGNSAPSYATNEPYPDYFALQLGSKIIKSGGEVVSASSNYSDLNVYAVMESNGDLDLLVINTNPAAAITNQFDISGFQPDGQATVWQYGEAQDTAQKNSSSGTTALANSTTTLTLTGSDFSYTFPAYSMTVLDLALLGLPPTVATPAAAAPTRSRVSARPSVCWARITAARAT